MFRIKRTKPLPPPALGAPSIHYATGAAPLGSISGWTRSEEQAAVFSAETVARIKAFHADRKHVGTLTPEPVQEMPAPVFPVDPKSPAGDEFAELLADYRRLVAKHGELEQRSRDAIDEAREVAQKHQEEASKAVELEDQLAARSKEAEDLTARVAELQAALVEAQEAATQTAVQVPAPAAPDPPESRGSRRNPK